MLISLSSTRRICFPSSFCSPELCSSFLVSMAFSSTLNGRRKVKVLPSPSWLSTSIEPPILSRSALTIDIPRPVPLYSVLASFFSCVKGLNSCSFINSSLIPIPVSTILNSYHTVVPSQESSSAYVSIVPFDLLYLIALLRRLTMIRRSCRELPFKAVCWILLLCLQCVIPDSTSWASTSAATSSISSFISNTSSWISNIPASSLLISRTSLTSSSKCRVDSWILSRLSSTFSRSSLFLRMISTIPMIPLIGVRISWLMRFINSVLALFSESASS